MSRKMCFILRHVEPKDDLQYIIEIMKVQSAKIKILILKAGYLFEPDNRFDYLSTAEQVIERSRDYVKAELRKLIENGAKVGYYEGGEPKWWDGFYDEAPTTYGEYIAFKNSGIKWVIDPYNFVADAVKQGYEIIKW